MNASSSTAPGIYFDNSLVAAVVKHDHPDQVSAISSLLAAHKAGRVVLSASTNVRTEIERLPAEYQGRHLAVYEQLRELPWSGVIWREPNSTASARTDPVYRELEGILPHLGDRLDVFQAIKSGLAYFATVDRRTILSRAPQIEALFPIRLRWPAEIVTELKLPHEA